MKSILKLLLVSRMKDSVLVCICPYMYFFSGACLLPFLKCLIILHNVNIQIKASKITQIISIISLGFFPTFKFCKSVRRPGSKSIVKSQKKQGGKGGGDISFLNEHCANSITHQNIFYCKIILRDTTNCNCKSLLPP